jgi:septum formation protein
MLILASNSPRRKQLLQVGGWQFRVIPVDVEEQVQPGESPESYVRRLAETKALALSRRLEAESHPEDVIVAADTAVVDAQPAPDRRPGPSGFEILGKPADADQARAMLRQLRGRSHQVYTAVAVLPVGQRRLACALQVTEIAMRNYSDAEIEAYIASGDPLDKAGAEALQHPLFPPGERFTGCYANVMGLPVCTLNRLLEAFGLSAPNKIIQQCQEGLEEACQLSRQALGYNIKA